MIEFDVRRCRRDDYPEFLDVLNVAFGHSAESCWFQKNIDNCTPYPQHATDEMIANHVIAVKRDNGKIMGGVGAYLCDIVVSDCCPGGGRYTLPAVGIGQVSCAVEYRNSGVMRSTLQKSLDDAAAAGAVIGFLGGDRYRYGRFGFDYGGGELILDFRYNRLKTSAVVAPLKWRKAEEGDAGALNALYESLPSYIKRGAEQWKMQLERGRFIWMIGDICGNTAYMAYDATETNKNIAEIYGAPETALAMVLKHMEIFGIDRVSVSLPYAPGWGDPMYARLRGASSYARVAPCGMDLVAMLSPDKIINILKPAIDRMGVVLGEGAGMYDDLTFIEYILGSPGHPYPAANTGSSFYANAAASASAGALPQLTMWLPNADGV